VNNMKHFTDDRQYAIDEKMKLLSDIYSNSAITFHFE
jgi:hypothetical protein